MATEISLEASLEISRAFTPTSPVDERSLFAGRRDQMRKVIEAVHQRGQHVIIYGERGVGKTSLSNVLAEFLPEMDGRNVITPRVNCESTDTFSSIFKKAVREIELIQVSSAAGFVGSNESRIAALELADGDFSPDGFRRVLSIISRVFVPVIILDEFDRLGDEAKHAVADAIKSLSDHAVDATVVVVGVADTVIELIREHESIERALVQIYMPRMSASEVDEIIEKGCDRIQLRAGSEMLSGVRLLAQGLPHYAHLLGLHGARFAVSRGQKELSKESVNYAIDEAVATCQQSIQNLFHTATMSPRKDNLFSDVLLACALAKTDEMGYFAAQDVREPMQLVTGKDYQIPSFSQHLNEFTEKKRGPVLRKIGTPRRYRFRFINPLLQPHVIMWGCKAGKVEVSYG